MDKKLINPIIILPSREDKIDMAINNVLTKMELPCLRNYAGLTQKELSNITGLSIQCISSIESPRGNPTYNSLTKYLNALGYEIQFRKKIL